MSEDESPAIDGAPLSPALLAEVTRLREATELLEEAEKEFGPVVADHDQWESITAAADTLTAEQLRRRFAELGAELSRRLGRPRL